MRAQSGLGNRLDQKLPKPDLGQILEAAPDAMVVADEEGRIVLLNGRAERLLGYVREELLGEPVEMLLPERFRARHEQHRMLFGQKPQVRPMGSGVRIFARRKDGREIPVEISLSPLETPEGLLVVSSIRERDKAQEALIESEARLRVLLETTNAVPWEADARTWQFTYVGPQAIKLLGYPLEQWYGNDFWPAYIHPDDRDAALKFCMEASATRDDYEFEYRMIAADGRIVWLHDIVSVVREAGEPISLRGFLIDITERKRAQEALVESERQLRLMADALPVLISFVDAERRYQFNNVAYEKFLGLPRTAITGRTVEQVLGPEAYRVVRPYVDTALAGREVEYEMELPIRAGTTRKIHASYVPHFGKDGNVTGFYSLMNDITERVAAEEEATQLRDRLAYVARLTTMGELAASIAHEVNQPLTTIATYAQASSRMMRSRSADESELLTAMEQIGEEALRAGGIVHRLREMVRKRESRRIVCDINELIRDVAQLAEVDARLQGIELRFELEDPLPPVSVDGVQIQQVILNLIRNAIEAIEVTDGPSGDVSVKTSLNDVSLIHVSVTDVGAGLSPEDETQLFHPFFTTKEDGMGMGLSISRSIIESHGGQMWFTRNQVAGTTFHFSLPIELSAQATGD